MSWTLGSTTLPSTKNLKRRFVEKSVYHEMINGTSKKDIGNRKEQFVIGYTRLTQAVVASILAEYELRQTLSFSIDDGELQVAATDVHVDISTRDYNTKGSEFREDVVMTLTEVS